MEKRRRQMYSKAADISNGENLERGPILNDNENRRVSSSAGPSSTFIEIFIENKINVSRYIFLFKTYLASPSASRVSNEILSNSATYVEILTSQDQRVIFSVF